MKSPDRISRRGFLKLTAGVAGAFLSEGARPYIDAGAKVLAQGEEDSVVAALKEELREELLEGPPVETVLAGSNGTGTVWGIARRNFTTVDSIVKGNRWLEEQGRISDDGETIIVHPGEKLRIPEGSAFWTPMGLCGGENMPPCADREVFVRWNWTEVDVGRADVPEIIFYP